MKQTFFVGVAASLALFPFPAFAEAPVVHVDAADSVVVERAEDGARVCQAPCDVPLEPSIYRLVGDGMRTSNDFRVPERADPIKIGVDAKPSGGFVTGVVLTALGGAFLAGGLAMLLGATTLSGSLSNIGASIALGAGGVGLLAGSIGLGIPGIYLLATNMQSRARVVEGDLRATASRDPAPATRAFTLPIASGSF